MHLCCKSVRIGYDIVTNCIMKQKTAVRGAFNSSQCNPIDESVMMHREFYIQLGCHVMYSMVGRDLIFQIGYFLR